MKERYNFEDFIHIISRLRSENGCPWDKVQTHESLREAMLEEAYEVVDAIEKKDNANLCEELGDVLLQVVFHSQIEKEENHFDINDVIDGISKKMIRRHPHIFADGKANTPEEVLLTWEEIKKKEKKAVTQTELMKAVPQTIPSLTRARKVQKKAAEVGFDFSNEKDVLQKVYEELEELKIENNSENGNIEEEFGDVLFSLVNLSRFLQINPDFALTKATKKFINRFEYVEKSTLSKGKTLSKQSFGEMDLLWEKSKKNINPCD